MIRQRKIAENNFGQNEPPMQGTGLHPSELSPSARALGISLLGFFSKYINPCRAPKKITKNERKIESSTAIALEPRWLRGGRRSLSVKGKAGKSEEGGTFRAKNFAVRPLIDTSRARRGETD